MNITDFFDCYNINYIVAYRELETNGKWPDGFITDDIEFSLMWQIQLAYQMTNAWVEQACAGNVIGIPTA